MNRSMLQGGSLCSKLVLYLMAYIQNKTPALTCEGVYFSEISWPSETFIGFRFEGYYSAGRGRRVPSGRSPAQTARSAPSR